MIIKSVSYIISWADIKASRGFCFQCWQQYDGPAIKNSRKYDDIRYLLFCLHFISKFVAHLNGSEITTHKRMFLSQRHTEECLCTLCSTFFAQMNSAHVEIKNNFLHL